MKRFSVVATTVFVISAVGPVLALAGSHPRRQRCHEVDATFTSELVQCQESPLGCAAGFIQHDSVVGGAMFVTLTGGAPLPEVPPATETVISVTTERSLSPRRGGTVSLDGFGIFDTAEGLTTGDFTGALFTEVNFIIGGTGHFEGATGMLFQHGWATGPTTFAGEIRGRVCKR